MALNVTTAVFGENCNTATASPSLAQWDTEQVLQISGIELPDSYKVEFSTVYTRNAIPAIGDASGVAIPNVLLQRSAPITAYVVLYGENGGRNREYWITIHITPGQPPETTDPDPEQEDVIDQAIAALNNGVERAAAAAEAAAGSATAADGSAEDAEAWAVGQRSGEDVDVDDPTYHNNAKHYAGVAQAAAEEAGRHEASWESWARRAETAAGNAEGSATAAGQSKTAAEAAAQAAAQKATEAGNSAAAASSSAASARQTVDGAIGAINTARDGALTAIGSAGSNAVGAVEQAGTTQTGRVTNEGNTQVNRVQTKGDEVIGSIPQDYSDLVDDVADLTRHLNVVERFSMDFLENGASTDNDYYKSLEIFLTNGKYYAFGIIATESCKGRISTYYTPNSAGKVEDVGEYGLTANTEYILYGYNPPSTVANVRLAKVIESGIAPVAWTLKVYEIKEKANKSNLDAVEAELTNDIDNLKDAVMESLSDIGRASKSFDGDDFTSHDLYFADGTPHEYASPWCSTDFVNCIGYTKISYVAEAFYSAQYNIDVAFVSFFDSDKVMIASLNSSDYTNGKVSGTTTIPTNAVYVRVVGKDTKTRSLTLEANGYMEKIDQVWNDVETGLKICCIGDSLTEGVDGETAYPPHVIAENYPFFMGKYLKATMLNYGKAGTSPNTWWANLATYGFTFDSTIDVVLIMFGTNGNLNTNTLATDVEPYDDWHDYANTGVGCYCKIIEYIMEETSNHAQIILCTAPFNHYDEDDYSQRAKKSVETTKAIAERYLLPVIDVYYESGLNDFNGDVFRPHDNLHFSAKGYHKLGTFIGSQTKAYLSRFSLDDEYNDELPIT